MNRFRAAVLVGTLAACASVPPLPPAPILIFGEQHDQPDQQRQVAGVIERLTRAGELGAVVVEMADRGRSTAGLDRSADEAAARTALGWSGWDWQSYAPVVMAAVRAGVPVLGGNLPREALRPTMGDTSLDNLLAADVRERIAAAVREGHCNLLPPAQEPGMLRVQIARDRALAETLAQAARAHPGQRVLLLAGAQHAARDHGVPLHLAALGIDAGLHVVMFTGASSDLVADERWPARVTLRPDRCAGLREQLERRKPPV